VGKGTERGTIAVRKQRKHADGRDWDAFARSSWVPETGFVWRADIVPEDSSHSSLLGPWLIAHRSPRERRALPLRERQIHRLFARLARSKKPEDDILKFANTWGALSHGVRLYDPALTPRPSAAVDRRIGSLTKTAARSPKDLAALNAIVDRHPFFSRPWITGNSLEEWQTSTVEMLALTEIWDLVRYEREDLLAVCVAWGRGRVRVDLGPLFKPQGILLGGGFSTNDERKLTRWSQRKILDPILHYVHERVNSQLERHTSPMLLAGPRGLADNRRYSSSELRMVPDCLLGALYVSFALEISGLDAHSNRRPRQCAGCYRWFPARSNQLYHPECREAAKKRRQRSRLAQGGSGRHMRASDGAVR
jgi:hypothetical protein